jgi:hypothetical protein
MENINFDFNKFLEEQSVINNQLISSNQNIGMAIKTIKENAIDSLTEQVDGLTKIINKLENDIKCISVDNKEIKEDFTKTKKELNIIKDKTDVLEFEDSKTMGEIKKTAKSRITYLLGGNDTPQYITLFRTCITDLYSNITNNLCEGKRLGKIKTEDGQSAITIAKRYQLNTKVIKKKLYQLQSQQTQGLLSNDKSKALEDTLEWMEGRM